MTQTLWAVSDLHATSPGNRPRLEEIQPTDPSDWLIVAGDVAERTELVLEVLNKLRKRFAQVIWVPGNHELFSKSTDRARGRAKYDELVEGCRRIDVLTPEDPYPVFGGVTIVPLFTLYDYTFKPAGLTPDQAVQAAHDKGIVLSDEISIAPFVNIRAWCWDRLAYSMRRLSRVSGPTILVNHWPLVVEPVNNLYLKEIALWCGTIHTRHWASRFDATTVIYGHLHIPGETIVDGVRHVEVSLGYPKEWSRDSEIGGGRNNQPWPYKVMEVN